MKSGVGRRPLFPVNVWPPLVDALTLVLAAFVLMMLVAMAAQRSLIAQLRQRDTAMRKLQEDKARIEKRLAALAGLVEVEGDKVILQGEVLFDSGSAEMVATGREFLGKLAAALNQLLEAEPDQMVMITGHTDDLPIHSARFPSNWDLSTSRAVAVARMLVSAGLSPRRVVAAGLGPYHPRSPNADDASRRRNRRIEVLVVPIRAVTTP